MKAAVALGLARAGIPAAVNSQPAQAGQNRAGIGTICGKEIDLVRLPQRLFPLFSIALFVLLFAGLCPAVSADVGEQGDIIAKLSIDLNNDGYNENIEILRTSDIDMCVRLIRGTKNGQITDLSESLPFEHLVGLTVYPIMGATYPRAVVIQGTAGAHRSFLNVYYIGEDGRFSKLFECSGDGGASLFGPLTGGGYGIMVCNRLYDTLNRDETKYYHWDGSEFVLVRREIGYHFTGKFVYPRDPETVAAAYVEAAVLGLDHELKQYIGARFDDERVRLERLGDLLHKRFGDFTGVCVSTPSELKSPESWAPKAYNLPVTFYYEDAVSKEASLLVELDKDESGSWRVIDVEISG